MRSMKQIFSLIVAVAIIGATGACAGKLQEQEPRIEYREVPIAVATGCIGKDGRPEAPTTLKQRYTKEQWASLAPGARQAAVQAQAGARMNYEDALRASTSGCQ